MRPAPSQCQPPCDLPPPPAGDKDTFAIAFALAGKAHAYRQVNFPPAGTYSRRDHRPDLKDDENAQTIMNRQGGWWLQVPCVHLSVWGLGGSTERCRCARVRADRR